MFKNKVDQHGTESRTLNLVSGCLNAYLGLTFGL